MFIINVRTNGIQVIFANVTMSIVKERNQVESSIILCRERVEMELTPSRNFYSEYCDAISDVHWAPTKTFLLYYWAPMETIQPNGVHASD